MDAAVLSNIFINIKNIDDVFLSILVKVKLATVVEGDPKFPFSIAITPRCRRGRYSSPLCSTYP